MPFFSGRRRSFLQWLGTAPIIGPRIAVGATVTPQTDVYRRIGVRPFINARGTWTYLSGSLELPEVRRAVEAAAHQFVDIFELQRAAGRKLAELSGAESGIVTSGSAGAMAAATAACIAGTDPAHIWALPDTTGLKNEVVMMGGRTPFDSAIRLTGARLVIARRVDDLASTISNNTAMIYTTWRDERLPQLATIAKQAKVPLLLDDAAGIPPLANLSRPAKLGVDLYCFSGGKGLRGPQCAGILLGRKDLIEAALANYSPWEGAVCRPMKVGKEEVIGLLAALEAWQHLDLDALNREWNRKVERIAHLVESVPGVKTEISIPKDGNSYPTLTVNWDEGMFRFTVAQCDHELRIGEPRIEVLTNSNPSLVPAVHEGDPKHHEPGPGEAPKNRLQIVSMTLQDGEELIIGRRLRDILATARRKAGA